jgi:chromosome segregation ATPase
MLEIKNLKASIPFAEKLLQLKPEIDNLYGKRKEISDILNGFQADIDVKDQEIDAIKKEMEEARDKRADIKEQVDKFEEDI